MNPKRHHLLVVWVLAWGLGLAAGAGAEPRVSVIQEVGAWVDMRLGSRREEAEANDSFIRLTPGFKVSSGDHFDERLRARVKLDLPGTKHRLSLLLLDEDEALRQASSIDLETDRLLLPDSDGDTRVGLQYVPFRETLQHVSATVSVDADLDASASLRWRRSFRIDDASVARLTLRPGWRDGAGFTTVIAADFDHRLGAGLLRYSLQGQHEDDGDALGTRLGYYYPLDEATLVGSFAEGQAAFSGDAFEDGGRFAFLLRRRLGAENYYFTFLPYVAWSPQGFEPDVQYGFEMELDIYFGGGRRGDRAVVAGDASAR